MAAAGPRGRDGPSPREFTAVRHFMMADLGLSGLPLLVYARIFGFCDAGCGYFESKGGLARFLNVQERSVHRAIRDLLDRGLIEECGVHAPARGHATNGTASCARGCRPERWQPLTIRQGSRRERVTK